MTGAVFTASIAPLRLDPVTPQSRPYDAVQTLPVVTSSTARLSGSHDSVDLFQAGAMSDTRRSFCGMHFPQASSLRFNCLMLALKLLSELQYVTLLQLPQAIANLASARPVAREWDGMKMVVTNRLLV